MHSVVLLFSALAGIALLHVANAGGGLGKVDTRDRLQKLRALFSSPDVTKHTNGQPIAAYILPSKDPHQSEFLSARDHRVRFISGFSGSNAYVIVTQKEALMWTDGRYYFQAEQQMDSGWTLMKAGLPNVPNQFDWIVANIPEKSYVAYDPLLFTIEEGIELHQKTKAAGIKAVGLKANLIDPIWTDRPKPTGKKLLTLSRNETGRTVLSKLNSMRTAMAAKKCNAVIFGALDDIMWLLNVRGFDIPNNPLAFSYLLVTENKAHLFIDAWKLDDEIRAHLRDVMIHPYEDVSHELKDLKSVWRFRKDRKKLQVLVTDTTNYAMGSIFEGHSVIDISPAQVQKASKNPTELRGMRLSALRDSAAFVEFLHWLEGELLQGREYTEIEAADKIREFQSKKDKFVEISYDTISSSGDHSAVIHYTPDEIEGQRKVKRDQVYLLDAGAHYRDGTTDVTRTVWIGEQSKIPQEFIKHNTMVIQGHIQLANAYFPRGTGGAQLDAITRMPMWKQGLDFGHSTGHGVGYFLNVHEGPAWISIRLVSKANKIYDGFTMTIEPGYYIDRKWGTRLENVYEVKNVTVPSGSTNFLEFRSLSLVPIQTNIIDTQMLSQDEKNWLNAYHDRVLSEVGDFLQKNQQHEVYEWLKKACTHLL